MIKHSKPKPIESFIKWKSTKLNTKQNMELDNDVSKGSQKSLHEI